MEAPEVSDTFCFVLCNILSHGLGCMYMLSMTLLFHCMDMNWAMSHGTCHVISEHMSAHCVSVCSRTTCKGFGRELDHFAHLAKAEVKTTWPTCFHPEKHFRAENAKYSSVHKTNENTTVQAAWKEARQWNTVSRSRTVRSWVREVTAEDKGRATSQ